MISIIESIDRSDCNIKFSEKDYKYLQSVVAEGTEVLIAA